MRFYVIYTLSGAIRQILQIESDSFYLLFAAVQDKFVQFVRFGPVPGLCAIAAIRQERSAIYHFNRLERYGMIP